MCFAYDSAHLFSKDDSATISALPHSILVKVAEHRDTIAVETLLRTLDHIGPL
jgi:hypothetical protein